MSSKLHVFLHNIHAGELKDKGNATVEFQYSSEYIAQKHPALSLSLPVREDVYADFESTAFFAGLLPDDKELVQLAKYLGISRLNVFKLLEEVGGECAGAVSLYSQNPPSELQIEYPPERISSKELGDLLKSSKDKPMTSNEGDTVRLSLAGAQTKIALIIKEDKYYHSTPKHPSTHIFKPQSEQVPNLVQNEYFCMQLASCVGIKVPETKILTLDNTETFQILRYDRSTDDGFLRWHQEDFCQALNCMPEMKYQGEGGPSLSRCIELIEDHSTSPAQDYIELLDRVIFNYLIGNNDAHGKNFSILYKKGGIRLAPAYDLVSTEIYPGFAKKMAMKIDTKSKPDDVMQRHWESLVKDTKLSRKNLYKQQSKMANKVEKALSGAKIKLLMENDVEDIYLRINAIIVDKLALIRKRIEADS